MDWNRRTCARRGHLTYSPDEEHLRDRLHVATPIGEAWRCLRCGDYTVGAPGGSGPAEGGPLIVRGPVLRELIALRLIAAERTLRGVVLLAAAYGIWRVQDLRTSLTRVFAEDLPVLRPVATELADLFGGAPTLHILGTLFAATADSLPWLGLGVLAFALLRIAEGAGLWFGRRWAIYLSTVVGALVVVLEAFAVITGAGATILGAVLLGAAIVAHLLYQHRLFTLRGGRRAITRAHRVEAMLEVVKSAGGAAR